MSRPDPQAPVVVGATGHVGSALVERLVADGRPVRCLVRDASRPKTREVEVVDGDLRDRPSLDEAFAEGAVARNFAEAARDGGAARIVYLGRLVDEDVPDLSESMAMRHTTVVRDRSARELSVTPMGVEAAITAAL